MEAVAIAGLVKTINESSELVSLPTISFPKSEFELLEEVLESPFFDSYRRNHEFLEDATRPQSTSLVDLRESAVRLQRRFSDRLDLKPTLIPIINVTSKLIDAVFGKLPGILASAFGSAAQNLIEDRGRIRLIDARPQLINLFRQRLKMLEAISLDETKKREVDRLRCSLIKWESEL